MMIVTGQVLAAVCFAIANIACDKENLAVSLNITNVAEFFKMIITVLRNMTNKIFKISQIKCFKYAPSETGDHRSRCYPQAGQTCPHPR